MSDVQNAGLPKRFYKSAAALPEADGFAVHLDARPLKTPGRRALLVPHEDLAAAIAAEWEAQGERIDPATMPLTRLVNTVLDGIADDPGPLLAELKRFSETDLLFYRTDEPRRLAERLAEGWDPVLRWAETHVGALFRTANGVMHVSQAPETLAAFARRLERESDPFALAALHQMATLTGSLILALAVREGHLADGEAWRLAHLDEDWNIEQWGADEEAARRREQRFIDMRAAAVVAGR